MDDKTEELRDIFLDVSDDETVTESQQDTHGSLASDDEIDARIADTVTRMREEFDFFAHQHSALGPVPVGVARRARARRRDRPCKGGRDQRRSGEAGDHPAHGGEDDAGA